MVGREDFAAVTKTGRPDYGGNQGVGWYEWSKPPEVCFSWQNRS